MSDFPLGVVVLGVLTGVLFGTTLWFYRQAAMRASGENKRAAEDDQERFQALFHSSTCGTIEIGPDGIIRLFNPAAEKVFGYKSDEVVGKNVSMLMPEPNRSGHDQFLSSYLDTRAAKVIGIGRDVVALRKNGEEFPAHLGVGEITISGRTSFVGTIMDVSDQVWATRRAEESQRHLELLANANPSLVSHVGADLKYLYVNRAYADWYGKKTHEIIGKTVRELHGDDEYQRLRPHIETVLSGKEIEFSVNLDAVGTDVRSIHVRLVPDVQDDETVAGYFVFTSEITERVRLEAQLRQAQKMEAVGQLTGGVAHDFNNLLAIIQGNLSLLMHDLDQGRELRTEDLRESISAALQASERGAELTHRLLAFSRRQPLQPVALGINAVALGMEELLRRTLGEDIDLRWHLECPSWRAAGDVAELENALLNLALNARDAMPEGGMLTIETAEVTLDEEYVASRGEDIAAGDYVMLAVSDTGTGMDAETLARVFEPFFTTKDVGKGTGLGLSMVYGFAKQSHGHVAVYSEPGEGTTVKLYLPRTIADEAHVPEKAPAALAAAREGETILVVEDDDAVRPMTVRILTRLGYRVLEAADGQSALTILDGEERIDLLLSDVVLAGGMSGPDIVATLPDEAPTMTVLYMSGYTENAILHQGRLDEGINLIGKPFTAVELSARIRDLLDAEESDSSRPSA